jgi:hypothetical protein
MRRAVTTCLLALPLLGGCHQPTTGDVVRQNYDNTADEIDREADAQPTPQARKIYKARADAFREEGKDREKGLEGGKPSSGPDRGSTADTGNAQR